MVNRKCKILIVISFTLISLLFVVVADNFLIYAQNSIKYKAKLTGDNVVPPVNTTAVGKGTFFIDKDHLWWKLNLTGITDPTMTHIHMAKKGVNVTNATIVADLLKSLDQKAKTEKTKNGIIIKGSIDASELLGPMKDKNFTDIQSAINNGTLQIDLHTKKHPDGELRGTIKISGSNTTKQISGSANTTLSS